MPWGGESARPLATGVSPAPPVPMNTHSLALLSREGAVADIACPVCGASALFGVDKQLRHGHQSRCQLLIERRLGQGFDGLDVRGHTIRQRIVTHDVT